MRKFKVEIASVPDRENLVAEIWYGDHLIAEINQESEDLEIEIYSAEKLKLPYQLFYEALQKAKDRLKE